MTYFSSRNILSIALVAAFIASASAAPADDTLSKMRRSLVRIQTVSQTPDYNAPWNPGSIQRGTGAGFVISGNRIMTNAHVVSNDRMITVTREGDPNPYPAKVAHVAHDCDLAILEPLDASFFDGMLPLEFGGLPAIESTVMVYGYPIGGDRLSVTRGIVSRIDFQSYSHSGADSHLSIQIDAAINPGNSGGPVMQDGRIVGVAFQGYSGDVAQNTGFMIPTPVVKRFLLDIEDGVYDRYMDLSLTYYPLFNRAARRALGLESNDVGVLVGTVFGQGASADVVQPGDVITAIDGFTVASDGSVDIEGERVEMAEIVERKFKGDSVALEILRDRKPMSVEVLLEKPFPFSKYANAYDVDPRYLIFGGLVFQPVDSNFLGAARMDNQRTRFLFDNFLADQFYKDLDEIVILSSILQDPVNSFADPYLHSVIEKVNGKAIRNLDDLASAFDSDDETFVLEFLDGSRPFVLEGADVQAARKRILSNYGVSAERNLIE